MSKVLTGLLVAGLLGGGACVAAEKEPSSHADNKAPVAAKHRAPNEKRGEARQAEGYLGIAIEARHSRLVEDVERLFGRGQGVLIRQVADQSPAAKAGLRANDIVLTYDDQKIYSPLQLERLVRNDKPGREATIGILRDGQSKEFKVAVGDSAHAARQDGQALYTPKSDQPRSPGATTEVDETWSSFDSLVLQREGKDDFKAVIKYRDDHGKLVSRDFAGSIAVIRKDIQSQTDIPAIEREHLLRALNTSEHPMTFSMPGLRVSRGGKVTWDPEQMEREAFDGSTAF